MVFSVIYQLVHHTLRSIKRKTNTLAAALHFGEKTF